MKKLFLQAAGIGVCILALWLGMSQIDFMKLFKVSKVTSDTEKKVGELFWESIENTETIVRNDSVNRAIDKIVTRITEKNHIDRNKIKVHVIQKEEANAFAMPGNHLIVYTGLINECDNESQLAGVLGHEIAHIQKRHVMKKMVKEIGFSAVLAIAGGRGGHMASEALRMLSSSAYDRKLESEADFTSVDYMIDADIDPAPFADLMFKMSTEVSMPSAVYWISTHPESEERAKAITNYLKGKKSSRRKS